MGRQKRTETLNPKSALLNTSHKLLQGQTTCTSYLPLGHDLGRSYLGAGKEGRSQLSFCFGENSHFSQNNSPKFPLFWGACRHQSVYWLQKCPQLRRNLSESVWGYSAGLLLYWNFPA